MIESEEEDRPPTSARRTCIPVPLRVGVYVREFAMSPRDQPRQDDPAITDSK